MLTRIIPQIARHAGVLPAKLEFSPLSHAVGEMNKAETRVPASPAAGQQRGANESAQGAGTNAAMAGRNVFLHNSLPLRAFSTTTAAGADADIAQIYSSINDLFKKGASKTELKAMLCKHDDQAFAITTRLDVTKNQRLAAMKLRKLVMELNKITGQLVQNLELKDGKLLSLGHIFNDEHLGHIRASTCERLKDSAEIRKAMPLEELRRLGIKLSSSENIFSKEELAHCARLDKGLSVEQAMALTAYTHQNFHTFNVLNLIHRSDGVPAMKEFFEPMHQLIFEAQMALRDNPDFHKTNVTLYKGLRVLSDDELSKTLEHYQSLVQKSKPFIASHVVSTTSEIFQSYAYRDGYNVELKMTGVTATAAHFFNHARTVEEMEHLAPRGTEFEVVPDGKNRDQFGTREVRRGGRGGDATVYVIEMAQISSPFNKIKP